MESNNIKMNRDDLMIKYNKVLDWYKLGPNKKL